MRWDIIARAGFIIVVAYCAMVLHPLGAITLLNVAFGAAIAVFIIFLGDRLRQTPLANVIGAIIGGTAGLLLARLIGDAHFWANAADPRVVFLHTLILLVLPYIGLVLGAKSGEWLEPGRLLGAFQTQSQPQRRYRILDTSVIIDGRI